MGALGEVCLPALRSFHWRDGEVIDAAVQNFARTGDGCVARIAGSPIQLAPLVGFKGPRPRASEPTPILVGPPRFGSAHTFAQLVYRGNHCSAIPMINIAYPNLLPQRNTGRA